MAFLRDHNPCAKNAEKAEDAGTISRRDRRGAEKGRSSAKDRQRRRRGRSTGRPCTQADRAWGETGERKPHDDPARFAFVRLDPREPPAAAGRTASEANANAEFLSAPPRSLRVVFSAPSASARPAFRSS